MVLESTWFPIPLAAIVLVEGGGVAVVAVWLEETNIMNPPTIASCLKRKGLSSSKNIFYDPSSNQDLQYYIAGNNGFHPSAPPDGGDGVFSTSSVKYLYPPQGRVAAT